MVLVKITQVEKQKKHLSRFNIFLDGQFVFGADEDLVVDRRLVVGKEISEGDLEKILFETQVGKLMERIYGLFNIRMRSKKELRDYLRNLSFKRKIKGQEEISEMVIESTIERAIKKGLIDDEQFAKSWIESRSKKYGVNRIKQELFQKGIDKEIINGIMNNELRIMEEETAEKALERKINHWKNLEKIKFRKKAYDLLLRRGFDVEMVKNVVEKKVKELYNRE